MRHSAEVSVVCLTPLFWTVLRDREDDRVMLRRRDFVEAFLRGQHERAEFRPFTCTSELIPLRIVNDNFSGIVLH